MKTVLVVHVQRVRCKEATARRQRMRPGDPRLPAAAMTEADAYRLLAKLSLQARRRR